MFGFLFLFFLLCNLQTVPGLSSMLAVRRKSIFVLSQILSYSFVCMLLNVKLVSQISPSCVKTDKSDDISLISYLSDVTQDSPTAVSRERGIN